MQLRDRERHPYAGLRSFMPQSGGELRLYQAVREAVPVVDAAVCKLILSLIHISEPTRPY